MKEITVTLTGNKALDYIDNQHTDYKSMYESLIEKNKVLLERNQEITVKNINLQKELECYKINKHIHIVKNCNSDNKDVQQTVNLVNDTTTTKIIETNPIKFPATKNSKKNGTRWKNWELAHIETTSIGDSFSNLRIKLHDRSEAAIRSKLNEYGVGVRNDKIIKLK